MVPTERDDSCLATPPCRKNVAPIGAAAAPAAAVTATAAGAPSAALLEAGSVTLWAGPEDGDTEMGGSAGGSSFMRTDNCIPSGRHMIYMQTMY